MNPLEFIAFTPKSNCGQCGYPTCLALAVAVTKGGADPGACPFVVVTDLPEELHQKKSSSGLGAVEGAQEDRDMDLVAHLKSKVKGRNFRELAGRLGADWSADYPDVLRFMYLGRPVVLNSASLTVDNRDLVDPRDQILLYNYVAFGGGQVPDGNWVGMESLPNSISKIRTLATYCEVRLADRFTGRGNTLQELCLLVGGKVNAEDQSSDVGMIISVLPYIPLNLLFWDAEPEDGFTAKVKVLFDHHVMDFLDLESLVFAAERLADRLAELDEV